MLNLIKENWKSGLTVALISVPLSIALSVASGAGPIPGIITGVWATLIAGFLGGSNYNIIGAAGALTTVLFVATLAAPMGLGPLILPLIAIVSGVIILLVWAIGADRFLYHIPSSVMYGFAGGVAIVIAISQLFDATGLSATRTGTTLGDLTLFATHMDGVHAPTALVFGVFLVGILLWKRYITYIPAVIPAALIGIAFGYASKQFQFADLVTLGDKFGTFSATLIGHVPWSALPTLATTREDWLFLLGTAGTVALISILETLVTARIGDKMTKTESSARKELFGLALANIGSGVMGGLPATGVFIRAGANIKAGATHRTSAIIAALCTAIVALIALPYFAFIPMAVIAAILVNTALGLIEVNKFTEFFKRERQSFLVALIVLLLTVFEDAGIAVIVGAVLSLLFFAHRKSGGYFDIIFNFTDGTKEEQLRSRTLTVPTHKPLAFVTYSIAGYLGYIDSARHAVNLKSLALTKDLPVVLIRLRNLYAVDYEGEDMLVEAIRTFEENGTRVYLTSADPELIAQLRDHPEIENLLKTQHVFTKSKEAIHAFLPGWDTTWHASTTRARVAK